MALQLRIGDVVRMKKPHPCGGHLWDVRRLGADIGIACQKCGRYVLLPRSYLERRVRDIIPRQVLSQDNGADPGPSGAAA